MLVKEHTFTVKTGRMSSRDLLYSRMTVRDVFPKNTKTEDVKCTHHKNHNYGRQHISRSNTP